MRRLLALTMSLPLTLAACAGGPAAGPPPAAGPAGASAAPKAGGGTPSPAASASPTAGGPATASGTPGPAAGLRETGSPLDVGIEGPGYILVASSATPKAFSDVTLMRGASLKLTHEAAASPPPGDAGPGAWTLRTAAGGWVLGVELASDPVPRLPAESSSKFWGPAMQFEGKFAAPITFAGPAGTTPAVQIDSMGRLTAGGAARWLYLLVMRVESAPRLTKVEGGFRYNTGAGFAFVGLADLRSKDLVRSVGDACRVRAGWLPAAEAP